jgi:hypothetical protein
VPELCQEHKQTDSGRSCWNAFAREPQIETIHRRITTPSEAHHFRMQRQRQHCTTSCTKMPARKNPDRQRIGTMQRQRQHCTYVLHKDAGKKNPDRQRIGTQASMHHMSSTSHFRLNWKSKQSYEWIENGKRVGDTQKVMDRGSDT